MDYDGFRLRLQQWKKVMAANKCNSIMSHFDGHVDSFLLAYYVL